MGCLLWKIYFASVFLSIKKGSNFGPPIILYKLVDEEIGRILKISIMFCVGNKGGETMRVKVRSV